MKKKIIYLNEAHFRLLFESDDFSENLRKIQSLIDTNEIENIELAFGLGKGMESYVPNFNFEEYINQKYKDLFVFFDFLTEVGYDAEGETLSEKLYFLLNLTELYLGHNELTYIPKEIGSLQGLKALNLSNNALTSLPEEFGLLQNLESLNLNINSFTTLPKEIGLLQNLELLDLDYNKFTLFPNIVTSLKSLRHLSLSGNDLAVIPDTISKLHNLELLDLSQTNVEEEEIYRLDRLLLDCSIYITDI